MEHVLAYSVTGEAAWAGQPAKAAAGGRTLFPDKRREACGLGFHSSPSSIPPYSLHSLPRFSPISLYASPSGGCIFVPLIKPHGRGSTGNS